MQFNNIEKLKKDLKCLLMDYISILLEQSLEYMLDIHNIESLIKIAEELKKNTYENI